MDMGQINVNQLEYAPDLVDFMPGANDIDIVYELMLRQRDVALSETLEQLSDIGKDDISLKDETFRKLKALIEKNAGASKPTYTVEFI